MRFRSFFHLLGFCVAVAGSLPIARAESVAVYGLELEVTEERERLLIFAEEPLEPTLIPVDDRTLMVSLPGAVLDPTAPTRVVPVARGTVNRVTAFERAEGGEPEVRVVVERLPGAPPEVLKRASIVALDFEPRPRVGGSRERPSVSVARQNAPLPKLVTDIAQATGERLIFDDTLRGTITIEGPGQVSRGEALALLDSVLLLRGFAAIPAPGGVRKIVAIAGAVSPWAPDAEIPGSDALLTTLLQLENAKADQMLTVVRPMLGTQSLALAYDPTNSLILSGPASRLRRLRTAITALDEEKAFRDVVWTLEHRNARDVAELVEKSLGKRAVPVASWDDRTNAILLRLDATAVERARHLVDRLDRPPRGRGALHVVALEYADGPALAERLMALQSGGVGQGPGRGILGAASLGGRDYTVVADVPTHSLVIRADSGTREVLLDVIDALDLLPPRVRVEVTIATVSLGEQVDLGIEYLLPLAEPDDLRDLAAIVSSNVTGGGVTNRASPDIPFVASYTRAPLLVPITIAGQVVNFEIPRGGASILANDREIDTDILLRPQLVVTSGEEHRIFSGDNVPIAVAQSDSTSSFLVSQNIERRDVGLSLRLLPTLGLKGDVELELDVEFSSLSESLAGDVEVVGPTIREIAVQSKLQLGHDDVAVVAVLLEPRVESIVRGTPFLMDLPGPLGRIFRTTSDQVTKRYVLVAAEAEIVRPDDAELALALARELERQAESDPPVARRDDSG